MRRSRPAASRPRRSSATANSAPTRSPKPPRTDRARGGSVLACRAMELRDAISRVCARAGSADLLEALGVHIAAPAPVVERCLREVGIGFFFAPAWHGATKHAAPVRREIGVRTIFNLLGPLTNPAGARHQLLGVYDGALVEPLARALGSLGSTRAMVVHGEGGLDEFAPSGATLFAALQ